MTNIVVPELGEGIDKATLVAWLFKTGDKVTPEDDVAELVTDKATFNVSAPKSGTLRAVAAEGVEVPVGSVIGVVE